METARNCHIFHQSSETDCIDGFSFYSYITLEDLKLGQSNGAYRLSASEAGCIPLSSICLVAEIPSVTESSAGEENNNEV